MVPVRFYADISHAALGGTDSRALRAGILMRNPTIGHGHVPLPIANMPKGVSYRGGCAMITWSISTESLTTLH